MGKAIPTLSSEGWVRDLSRKTDRALAYAFLTDGLQSNIYRRSLTSIQDILQSTMDDEVMMVAKVRDKLNQYFNRLFDSAEVSVRVEPYLGEHSGILRLYVGVTVMEDGVDYQVSEVLRFVDGIFDSVDRANTYGADVFA